MKTKFISICVATCLFSCALSAANVINRCIRFEESSGEHTTQLSFEFLNRFYCRQKEILPGERLKLYFPNMRLVEFQRLGIAGKIKAHEMVRDVAVWNKNIRAGKKLIPQVVLSIQFQKDTVVLRITKMEDPNLFLLDIFFVFIRISHPMMERTN